jgi:TfoX/Sxy family transcriptional regulator of competence genes
LGEGLGSFEGEYMETHKEYLLFLLDQLSSLEGITYRRMMGEYILYYRGKVAAYVCDDRLLVKPVPSAVRMLPQAPYDAICQGGRKNYCGLTVWTTAASWSVYCKLCTMSCLSQNEKAARRQ